MIQLFGDLDSLARRPTSRQKTKLIGVVLECNFVELIQKMWRRYLCQELLEQKGDLPEHLQSSLLVIYICHFRINTWLF